MQAVQQTSDPRTAIVRGFGVRAYSCHPLLSPGGRILGTLSFGTRMRDRLDDDDLALMRTVTGYIAIALERRRNATERERLLEQMHSFVHIVSHDLRTPMTIIRGHAQLLRELFPSERALQAMQSFESIDQGIQCMDVMIDDLVDIARMEGGQMKLEPRPTRLAEYLPAFLLRNAGVLQPERIAIDMPADLAPVLVDQIRLERLLVHLLTNAQKYSAPATPIRIQVRQTGEEIATSIIDQGQRIAPNDLPHLFTRYYRARRTSGGGHRSWPLHLQTAGRCPWRTDPR